MAQRARDESRPLGQACPIHGLPYGEHRRCSECRAEALAALEAETGT